MIAKLTLGFAVVAVDVNVEFSVFPAAQQCVLLQATLMIETAAKDRAKGNGIRHTKKEKKQCNCVDLAGI